MVDTPSLKPKNGTEHQPFKRGQIEWGRPPQQLFRVGPLPRATGSGPGHAQAVGQTQRRPAGAGILSGSMIPGQAARPLPAAPLPPVKPTAPVPTPSIQAAPLAPIERPAPSQPEPRPAPAVAAAESTPAPAVLPIIEPEPVVPSYAAAVRPRSGVPTTVWIGGAVAAVVLAGVAWWVLKPDAPVPADTVVASTMPDTAIDASAPTTVEAVPVGEAPVDEAEIAAVPTTTPAVTRPTATTPPTTTATTRTAPTTSAPSLTPRLNTETNVPRIETAPLVVAPVAPPPTAAETPSSDPDAPVQTRPQPLD